jgi:hypothetical protein
MGQQSHKHKSSATWHYFEHFKELERAKPIIKIERMKSQKVEKEKDFYRSS